MGQEKIKVAVIGCGTIATSAHIPSYMNNGQCEIKYFCDIIPERADEAVKKNGCGKAVYDYREILDDPEIEAVSVCTPNMMHKTITIDFLKAGKNVLCEKPAARTYRDALEMQEAQHATGKILNIGVVNRFNASVGKIRELIQEGALGDVYHVYASFRAWRSIPGLGGAFTTNEIAGGGALIDWGVHYLDIVMFCTDDPEPLTASGRAFCKIGRDMKNYVYHSMWSEMTKNTETGTYDVDDSVTAFIRTSGPTITLNGAWAQNIGVGESFIDFLGDKAGIRLNYGGDFTMWSTAGKGVLTEQKFSFGKNNMFQNEIDSFLRSVKTGEKLPSHIDKNILTSKIMQAIYDSSAQNREIDLRK